MDKTSVWDIYNIKYITICKRYDIYIYTTAIGYRHPVAVVQYIYKQTIHRTTKSTKTMYRTTQCN